MPLPKPKGKGNKSIGWNWMFLKWFSIIAITVLVVANFASTNLSLSVPLSNILSESVPPLLHRTNTENDQEISLTDHPMDGENDNIREVPGAVRAKAASDEGENEAEDLNKKALQRSAQIQTAWKVTADLWD